MMENLLIDELEAMGKTEAFKLLISHPQIASDIGEAFANILDNARRADSAAECNAVLENHWLNLKDEYPEECKAFGKHWDEVRVISLPAPVVDA